MKMLHVLFALGALSLGSCQKQTADNFTPTPRETTPPVATPEAVAPPPTPDAENAPRAAAAPGGEYFLRAATSVQTTSGPVNFQAGTRLRQVGPGAYTAQGQTLTLRDDQVTDDPKLVRQPTVTEAAAQPGAPEKQMSPPDFPTISPETALQLSTDPQYQALTERAATLRSQIERVTREASRIPHTNENSAPTATALKKEREKLESELKAVTDEQTLLRTSK